MNKLKLSQDRKHVRVHSDCHIGWPRFTKPKQGWPRFTQAEQGWPRFTQAEQGDPGLPRLSQVAPGWDRLAQAEPGWPLTLQTWPAGQKELGSAACRSQLQPGGRHCNTTLVKRDSQKRFSTAAILSLPCTGCTATRGCRQSSDQLHCCHSRSLEMVIILGNSFYTLQATSL